MIATGFLKLNRRTTVDVYSNAAGEYTLASLRLDTERTFDPSKTKWKFWGPQGQADGRRGRIPVAALHRTELQRRRSGGIVECTIGESTSRIAQLVD